MSNTVQHWARKSSALFAAMCIAVVSAIGLAATAHAAVTANVVFGGFNDPSGQICTNGLLATGHINHGEQVVLPGYPAHMEPWIDGGMAGSTAKGLPGGIDAVNRLLAEGKRVELHGCSQGSDVAVAVSWEVSNAVVTVLHGSPHPVNGIFHAVYIDDTVLGDFIAFAGALPKDRLPKPGTHNFYNEGDVWNNFVANQHNPAALVAQLTDTLGGDGHWVQPLHGAKCTFTDSFGVVNHVFDDFNPVTKSPCD